MSNNFNKNRILKNSIILYIRMLFTIWLNLYATRLVLANLGVEDMGVYGVVGSTVTIFTVFTSGITSSVQRFITYELGIKNGNVNKVFCTSLNVLVLFALFMVLILETVGVWILNNKLNIPAESQVSAFWVFQLSVITCIFNLITIPYNALIIAHEKMDAFATISVVQVILTCTAAYSLSLFSDNKLLWYAILMAAIAIIIRIIYQIYCSIKLDAAKYHLIIDKQEIMAMGRFAGISSLSGIFHIITGQGITFVINWTFGIALNAVYNIALQVKNSVLSFALNLNKAIQPQITKTFAEGDIDSHKKLVYSGSKLEVYLILFIMIPFLFKTEYIMHLWLGDIPEYGVQFTRCILFISLTYAAFEPIRTAVLATNKIAKFMLIPDAFCILTLPAAYFISKITNEPTSMIITIVAFDMMTCLLRVYYGAKVSVIKCMEVIKGIIVPCMIVAVVSSLTCYVLTLFFSDTIFQTILLLCVNSLLLIITIITIGLNKRERKMIASLVNKFRNLHK